MRPYKITTPCIKTTKYIGKNGYGATSYKGKAISTHRLAYIQAYGPIPDGLCVLHKCDNRPCINPEHLFLGTRADNMIDKVLKGRATTTTQKLTFEQAEEIRRRLLEGETQRALAREYGVDQAVISLIKNRKTYKAKAAI